MTRPSRRAAPFLTALAILLAGPLLSVTPGPLPVAAAHAQSSAWCGDLNQRACTTQDCHVEAGWFIIVYPVEVCPPPCNPGLSASRGICVAPTASCDITCKMAKINQTLGPPSGLIPGKTMYCFGASYDPYGGKKVSRADLGVSDSDRSVVVDIGGEGLYKENGRQWGSDEAINLNCSLNQTTTPANEKLPIKNLVFGFVQTMPFAAKFADTISVNNAPLVASEIERVIRPGGLIQIEGTSDSLSIIQQIEKDVCVFPAHQFYGYSLSVQIRVPTNFNAAQPFNCPLPKGEL